MHFTTKRKISQNADNAILHPAINFIYKKAPMLLTKLLKFLDELRSYEIRQME